MGNLFTHTGNLNQKSGCFRLRLWVDHEEIACDDISKQWKERDGKISVTLQGVRSNKKLTQAVDRN